MIGFFAKLVVMSRSRAEGGRGSANQSDIAALAFEEVFVFKGELPSFGFGGVGGIIRKAEGDFAGW